MSTKLSAGKINPGMTTGLSLVVSLGAYCPVVKIMKEQQLASETARGKRRTRPMIGRGGFGAAITAKFALKRRNARRLGMGA